MHEGTRYTSTIALIVALGGFLMGFDASVIAGVVGFIEVEFELSSLQLGWSVSSLTLTATLGMMLSGPVSDRIGRRPVLQLSAIVFAISAVASAIAPNYTLLVLARMLGGFGVGAALIIAPMYIAEMAPAAHRGRLVSFNQLNIVIGISAAFFSNYLILTLGESDALWIQALNLGPWGWRWMLGVEALPALAYLLALLVVPESPRWLVTRRRDPEALEILERISGADEAKRDLENIKASINTETTVKPSTFRELFRPALKLVLTIGIAIGVLQQITGINAVFFYAPMIFEQSGIGTNAAFMQAVLVGLANLVFTIAALVLIDRLGRRLLLTFGLGGIAACMLTLAYGFGTATYRIDAEAAASLPPEIDTQQISAVIDTTYFSDTEFREALHTTVGPDVYRQFESQLISSAIVVNPLLILTAILGFVASFAISLGPVMWVLFSELFPNRVRGMAISFVGLINSSVSFLVTLVFPWELEVIGISATFLLYGIFALIGLVFTIRSVPETKGLSLEQLEAALVRK